MRQAGAGTFMGTKDGSQQWDMRGLPATGGPIITPEENPARQVYCKSICYGFLGGTKGYSGGC